MGESSEGVRLRTASFIIVIVACAGAILWWAAARQRSSGSARPAVILVSGDTAGWITPCGCVANQSGGLLRRGTYVRELQSTRDVIYADVGGAPAGTSAYQRAKFEAIVAGEIAMGIAAHNVGGAEAALGPEYLREMASRLKLPMICANARDRGGAALFPPSRIVDAGGRRIALVGVLSTRYATDQVQVSEPRQAVLAALASIKGQYDRAVILAYLPEDELTQLCVDVPEADAVVGGPTGQAIAPRASRATMLAAATNKGKFLVQLEVPTAQSNQRINGKIAEMGPSIADDPAQVQNLDRYLHYLVETDFIAEQSGLVPPLAADAPADYRIAGSESCRQCHPQEDQAWRTSAHSNAWHTLERRGFQADPYCLQCHTTGYGMPGGFESAKKSQALAQVGCENCHGPSTTHVRDPKIHTPFAAADQCTRCHDQENSPNFNFTAHWAKIQHGPHQSQTRGVQR